MQPTKLLSCAVTFLFAMSVISAEATATLPCIFHCSQTAGPGDVITLQGEGFGANPQVWMTHISLTGSEGAYIMPQKKLDLCTWTNITATAIIPANETPGIYAIFVTPDGTNFNARPSMINVPQIIGSNDLGGMQVDAGRSFHLYGRNLIVGPNTPTVNFVPTAGGSSFPATVDASTNNSDGNILHVTAPTNLATGTTYNVIVNNGYAPTTGIFSTNAAAMLPYGLTCVSGNDTKAYNLGVPWGTAFYRPNGSTNAILNVTSSPYLATNNGDDTYAVQRAIDATTTNGGIIYFPPGIYHLPFYQTNAAGATNRCIITLKPNVVLAGSPDGTSILDLYDASGAGTNHFGIYGDGITNSGIMNLTCQMTNAYAATKSCVYWHGSTNVFVNNAYLNAANGVTLQSDNNGNEIVEHSYLTNSWVSLPTNQVGQVVRLDSNNDLSFITNTVGYYCSRVSFDWNNRALIENNTINRNAPPSATTRETGGFEITMAANSVFHNNQLIKGGTGVLYGTGDGETILVQGGGALNQDWGTATGGGANTLVNTSTTKTWATNYAVVPAEYNYQPYYVAIVSGTGAGQVQKIVSNTTDTLTVATNWDVPPDYTSHYTIFHMEGDHQLVKGNTLQGNVQGIDYYACSSQNVTVVDNTVQDSGGILMRSDFRDIKYNTNGTLAVGGQLSVNMDNQIFRNTVASTNTDNVTNNSNLFARISVECASTSTSPLQGTQVYGTEVRSNYITNAPGGPGGTPTPPTGGNGFSTYGMSGSVAQTNSVNPTILGVVFQNNAAANTVTALHLATGDYNTVVWNNLFDTVGDVWGTGATNASINTIYATDGLTGLWSMEHNLSDSSGNLQPATDYPSGSASYSTDVHTNAPASNTNSLNLTGSYHLEVPYSTNSAILSPGDEMTVAFWMKATNSGGAYENVLSKDSNTTGYSGWDLQRSSTTGNLVMRLDTMSNGVSHPNQIGGTLTNAFDGNWHFIAYVVNRGTVQPYMDYTGGATLPTFGYVHGTGFGNTNNFSIGAIPGGSHPFTGELDEVQMYPTALTPSQVQSLYNSY